jgi:hypothetical protein
MKDPNRVIKILMERDGMTRKEAEDRLYYVHEAILDDPYIAEDILAEELGLEPDYLFDVIW